MMNSFLSMAMFYAMEFQAQEEKMCKEFDRRAEEARDIYWDACKYPRKKKKAVRKRAKKDFFLYKQLAKSISYSF